jgi:hypothetical protein
LVNETRKVRGNRFRLGVAGCDDTLGSSPDEISGSIPDVTVSDVHAPGEVQFHIANCTCVAADLLYHVITAIGVFPHWPLGGRRFSDPGLPIGTGFGKEVGKNVIRAFARGSMDDLDWEIRKGNPWI